MNFPHLYLKLPSAIRDPVRSIIKKWVPSLYDKSVKSLKKGSSSPTLAPNSKFTESYYSRRNARMQITVEDIFEGGSFYQALSRFDDLEYDERTLYACVAADWLNRIGPVSVILEFSSFLSHKIFLHHTNRFADKIIFANLDEIKQTAVRNLDGLLYWDTFQRFPPGWKFDAVSAFWPQKVPNYRLDWCGFTSVPALDLHLAGPIKDRLRKIVGFMNPGAHIILAMPYPASGDVDIPQLKSYLSELSIEGDVVIYGLSIRGWRKIDLEKTATPIDTANLFLVLEGKMLVLS